MRGVKYIPNQLALLYFQRASAFLRFNIFQYIRFLYLNHTSRNNAFHTYTRTHTYHTVHSIPHSVDRAKFFASAALRLNLPDRLCRKTLFKTEMELRVMHIISIHEPSINGNKIHYIRFISPPPPTVILEEEELELLVGMELLSQDG